VPRPGQLFVVRTQTPSWVIRDFEYADGNPTELQIDELERWALERADLVTAPSRLGARRLSERWSVDSEAARVIPNAIDAKRFTPADAPQRPASPIVLCVNRYSPLKGAEEFVRAAAIVHEAFPEARFRMLGRDADWQGEPASQYLRNLARQLGLPDGALEIPGPVTREALPAEYAAAEVCVNPSLYENVSHTALEALACGRPTVMTSGQGNAEYVTDGDDALVVPPGDVATLAAAIQTLLGDADLRDRMGAAARSTVERSLSSDVVVAQIENAYRAGLMSIASRRPLPPAKLYVGILTRNALEYTQRCLASLAAHTPVPHHIFILDNASTDATPEWLGALKAPQIHVTLSDVNHGVPGGRNRLLKTILPHLAPSFRTSPQMVSWCFSTTMSRSTRVGTRRSSICSRHSPRSASPARMGIPLSSRMRAASCCRRRRSARRPSTSSRAFAFGCAALSRAASGSLTNGLGASGTKTTITVCAPWRPAGRCMRSRARR